MSGYVSASEIDQSEVAYLIVMFPVSKGNRTPSSGRFRRTFEPFQTHKSLEWDTCPKESTVAVLSKQTCYHHSFLQGMMTKRLYFAYGSNMSEAQMVLRCPDSAAVGIARLNGYRFLINERGVGSIAESDGRVVCGLVWDISESDEHNLDLYEGVAKGLYRKSVVSVALQEGHALDVLVYVASSSKEGKPRPGYMEKIIRAAVGLGFPSHNLEELNSWLTTDAQNA